MGSSVTGLIDGTKSVQSAFAEMFSNIGKAFMNMVIQMLSQKLVLTVLQLLNPAPIKGLGSLGGLFGGSAPDAVAGGGLFSGAGPFQFRAAGGPVSARTPYIVGERGPELFVPGSSGSIIPNHAIGSDKTVVNGGINITVQNTGESLGAEAQKQIARQVQGIVMGTLMNERRSGGMLR
jgi:phage-related minor tail protein